MVAEKEKWARVAREARSIRNSLRAAVARLCVCFRSARFRDAPVTSALWRNVCGADPNYAPSFD